MISAVVLTRNEDRNIKECLKSVAWCDETIVIDDYSDDKTVDIAKSLGALVFQRKLDGNFAAQRNFGSEKAKGEWVLFIDADERVSKELVEEIKSRCANLFHSRGENVPAPREWLDGFYIQRHDVVWNKKLKHGEAGNIKLLRLAKRGSGKWKRRVHETWDIKGPFKTLKNPLLHYPHQTISEFLGDINNYSTLHAQENMKEGKRSSILKIMFYPKLKFLQNWILKGGFFDSGPGFVAALMMSFHSFLAWSKLWLLQRGK